MKKFYSAIMVKHQLIRSKTLGQHLSSSPMQSIFLPEKKVLQNATGHDEAGVAAHGEDLESKIGAQHICRFLCIRSSASTTTTAGGNGTRINLHPFSVCLLEKCLQNLCQ